MESNSVGSDMNSADTAAKTVQDPEVFWRTESVRMEQRLADLALHQAALDDLKEETTRLPGYYQRSLEKLLEDASIKRAFFMGFNGRKGGKQKDTLQVLIERIVEKEPQIDRSRLLYRLKAEKGFGVIEDITDEWISYESASGDLADVKISALKHRLSRAKKDSR
jgi:uncharacterized protein YihD (DUF1040 family)